MSTTSTILILGALGGAAYWMFGRGESYFVELPGSQRDDLGRSYEYFGDLGEARSYAREYKGALYQLPSGSEFDAKTARRLTPNARKKKRRSR